MRNLFFLSFLALLAAHISAMTVKSNIEKGCACVSEDLNGQCLQWVCGKRDIVYTSANKGCACVGSMTNGVCSLWNCMGK